MRILVCIKQVPESGAVPKIDENNRWISYHPGLNYKLNRFDEYALEEALKIGESFENVSTDVITIGPLNAGEVIKRAFGMGAEKGFHVIVDGNTYSDPYNTALLISEQAKKEDYDLILTGIMSEDMMQAQTGQMLAEILDIPCGTGVVSLSVDPEKRICIAEREIDGGEREKIKTCLPSLFTIQAGINTPRYPSLSNILAAKNKEILIIKGKEERLKQRVVSVDFPVKSRSGRHLEGSTDDKAKELFRILNDKNVLNN